MVRNDDFYLRKWVEYYGAQLGKENLYIYFDGTDQVIAPFCEGTYAELVPKIGSQVVEAEKGRLSFLSGKAKTHNSWAPTSDAAARAIGRMNSRKTRAPIFVAPGWDARYDSLTAKFASSIAEKVSNPPREDSVGTRKVRNEK